MISSTIRSGCFSSLSSATPMSCGSLRPLMMSPIVVSNGPVSTPYGTELTTIRLAVSSVRSFSSFHSPRTLIEPRPSSYASRIDRAVGDDTSTQRKVGPLDMFHQLGDGRIRFVDQVDASFHHFAQIVRRNVGRHADRDPLRAVDEQIGKPRRQNDRLVLGRVVGRPHVDRFGPQLVHQAVRRSRSV